MKTTNRFAVALAAAVMLAALPPAASAQCGPGWNTTIGVPGMNGTVRCMLVWDDGKGGGPALYVGGEFTTAGGFTVNGIAKWDGRIWTPLGPQNAPGVSGGFFTTSVNAMAVWNDGIGTDLYIGGDFTTAGGVTCNAIARWDGTAFSQFNGPQGAGVFGIVKALAVHQDIAGPSIAPALYVGGSFYVPGVNNTNNIARWSGEVWSALGTGVDNQVFALASFIDNLNRPRLYVGGVFVNAGGNPASHFAIWNGQASLWSQVGGGTDGLWVQALKVWDDGSGPALFVGGAFTMVGSTPANSVAKWDPFSGWYALGNGTTGSNGWYTGALAVYNDGTGESLYATAYFDNAGTGAAAKIAKWNGGAWKPVGTGLNAPGSALAVFDPGGRGNPTLYVGGQFTMAGGQAANHIARWAKDYAPSRCPADLNCDGVVNGTDLSLVLGSWGPCP